MKNKTINATQSAAKPDPTEERKAAQVTAMRIFISDLTGYIGNSVLKAFKTAESEDEIVGSVSGSVVPKGVTETAAVRHIGNYAPVTV